MLVTTTIPGDITGYKKKLNTSELFQIIISGLPKWDSAVLEDLGIKSLSVHPKLHVLSSSSPSVKLALTIYNNSNPLPFFLHLPLNPSNSPPNLQSCHDKEAAGVVPRPEHQLGQQQHHSDQSTPHHRAALHPPQQAHPRQDQHSKARRRHKVPDQGSSDKWPAQPRESPSYRASSPESENRHTKTMNSGVAVGSSIGHAVGGWFSGGSSSEPAQAQQDNMSAQTTDAGSAYGASSYSAPKACEGQISQFRTCMDQNQVRLLSPRDDISSSMI